MRTVFTFLILPILIIGMAIVDIVKRFRGKVTYGDLLNYRGD